MKQIIIPAIIVLSFVVSAIPVNAAQPNRNFGLGVILGEPTGFSIKKWTGSSTAIDGAAAWSFTRGSSFHLHADYLWHQDDVFQDHPEFLLYYGVGGRLKATSSDNNGNTGTRLGIRGVVGIDFLPERAPLDIFVELAPVMDFAPSTDLGFNGGVGIRYWFQ